MNQKKIISFVMAIVLLFSGAQMSSWVAFGKSIQELEKEINALESEENKLKKELKHLKSQAESQKKLAENLEKQIDSFNRNIKNTEKNIADIGKEVADTEKKIEEGLNLFKGRLKAMYMADRGSVLEAMLNSSSFSEYAIYTDAMERIASHDDRMIQDLTAKKKQAQAKKAEAEAKKVSLNEQKIKLEEKKKEAEKLEQDLLQQTDKTREEIQSLINEMNAANNEIAKIIRETQSSGDFIGGKYLHPVPGYTRISSHYGPRVIQGINDFHTGTDFPAPTGTPIVASNPGTVVFVKQTGGGYKGGYGRHLLIDHGGGQHTLYAHTNSINVQPGQVVKRGEQIATVGNTGWSTGPHLHFEIRINGNHVNPEPYIR